jgi:hypothetical protein
MHFFLPWLFYKSLLYTFWKLWGRVGTQRRKPKPFRIPPSTDDIVDILMTHLSDVFFEYIQIFSTRLQDKVTGVTSSCPGSLTQTDPRASG